MELPKTIGGWAIFLVIIAAICAVVWVAVTAFGIVIPGWVVTIFWILVVAVVVIAAIRFLASLGGGGTA